MNEVRLPATAGRFYSADPGRLLIQGLLFKAREAGLRAITVDLRNSEDTAGSKNRVVGYGAFLL